jgi:hypothetical protein
MNPFFPGWLRRKKSPLCHHDRSRLIRQLPKRGEGERDYRIMTNAETLIRKGKRGAAAFVQAECMANKAAADAATPPPEVPQPPAHLQALLDYLLHPGKDIGDVEAIDWCRWLVGGGEKPEDFSHRGD